MKYIVRYYLDKEFMEPVVEKHPIACSESVEISNILSELIAGENYTPSKLSKLRYYRKLENNIEVLDVVTTAVNKPCDEMEVCNITPVYHDINGEPSPVWIPVLKAS